MARVYYDGDANLGALHGKKIAIIGYGSQGHAHALNLKDSGQDVLVGLHAGSRSREQVTRDGLQVLSVEEAAKAADIVVMLVPDTAAPQIYRQQVEPGLKEGRTLMFAHGFNIHFGQIIPPKNVNVTMVAPKAPGHRMRELALVKVSANTTTRPEIMQLVDIFRAKIVDVAGDSLIVEVTGSEDKVTSLTQLLKRFGIKEMARTGTVAMVRGIAAGPRLEDPEFERK